MEWITGVLQLFGAMAAMILPAAAVTLGGIYGGSAAVGKYLEPLRNRNTRFGRIPLSRGRRKALSALVPTAIAAVEHDHLRHVDDKGLREFGMVLEGMTGGLAKEPDVVQALSVIKNEYERRAAVSHRVQWVISTIEERRAKAVDRGISDLERRNKARVDAGLSRIDDELLWKAPLIGTLGSWGGTSFATDSLQIAAVAQMEELLRTVAETSEQLLKIPSTKLTRSTFWAVGVALELFSKTLPKVSDNAVDQKLMDRLRGSYARWSLEAEKRGPAPDGESLLSREIIVNAAKHELDTLPQRYEVAAA